MVGASAAVLTTISFVPQVIKVWRKRRTEGLSSGMYILFTAGQILWIVYGIFLHSWPIILANATTACLSASVLFLMLQNKLRRMDARRCARARRT
jgi:MtN3 and saliva related transmembrane protein